MSTTERNIVIVGGGIIGCCTAYYLTRHPLYNPSKHKITLLESTTIAGGASGKAGGLMALWAYPKELVPLSFKAHQDLATEHNGAERWSYRAVHCGEVSCEGNVPVHSTSSVEGKDNAMDGGGPDAHLSLKKRSASAIARLRAAGVPEDLDWISPDALRGYEEMSTPSSSAQVHPFQFTVAMAELAAEKGADVKTDARVEEILYSGKRVKGVRYSTKEGSKEIDATDVVVAAGPWTPTVLPKAPIDALRAHSVTIRPTRPVSAYVLFTSIKLKSGKSVTPEVYARANEVYVCGEGDRLVRLPSGTNKVAVDEKRCQDIVDYAATISPELRDGEVTARQACYLPGNTVGQGHPLIGKTDTEGLYLCSGHTCWGIQNGPGSGKLMAEFVFDGEAKSIDASKFDPRKVL